MAALPPDPDLADLPAGAWLEEDADAPMPFAVWLDGDLLGVGESQSEALEDARKKVRGWEYAGSP